MTPPAPPESPGAHWKRNANHWQTLTSPLRPTAPDIALYQRALQRWRADHGDPACRILLLGVTQELRTMDWPEEAELLACDHSRAMIDSIWPLAAFRGRRAEPLCADWRALPLPPRSRNIAIGDGSASALSTLADLRLAIAELDRVLEAEATLILRLFLRPQVAEGLAAIAADAVAGRIGSFHAFKWRLAMAVQPHPDQGVRLGDVWDAFHALFPDRAELAQWTGWSPASIATIDSYRDADGRYCFHRLDEFADAIAPAFRLVSVDTPGYELGERCPVIAARRAA